MMQQWRRSSMLAVASMVAGACSDQPTAPPGPVFPDLQVKEVQAQGSWTLVSPMQLGRGRHATAVANGILYAVGGSDLSQVLHDLEAFNPATNTWTLKAPMPTARECLGAGAVNGMVYAVGGAPTIYSPPLGTLEAYAPATNTWSTKAPMPTPRCYPGVGVVKGILYVVGGMTVPGEGFTTTVTVEAYNPLTNTWRTVAPLPTPRTHVAVAQANGLLYAIGGLNPSLGYIDRVDAYNPETNRWHRVAPMPTPRSVFATGVVNGVIYTAGGNGSVSSSGCALAGGICSVVEVYDPRSNAWERAAPLTTPRYATAGGVIEGVFYVAGGLYSPGAGTVALNSVERYSPRPPLPERYSQLSLGLWHTCGLTGGGAAYCWGENYSGQLGDSTLGAGHLLPAPVTGGLRFTTLAAGYAFACGIGSGGAAYCWGSNMAGQLGDSTSGTRADRLTPTPVVGGLSFTALVAGVSHTCGLADDGRAYCWGANYGQLGDGTTTDRLIPTPVAGGLSFSAITTGYTHTCGLTRDGTTYCWGLNEFGAIGDGTTTLRLVPTPVTGGQSFTALAAGYAHTCGLTNSGEAYCWGINSQGQLGDDSRTDRLLPTPVAGGLRFTSIESPYYHACALTSSGAAWCWGSNGSGALGNGTTTTRLVPTPVAGGLRFTALALGEFHSCGISSSGAAYCWGNNRAGQLGDGRTTTSLVPTLVAGGVGVQ